MMPLRLYASLAALCALTAAAPPPAQEAPAPAAAGAPAAEEGANFTLGYDPDFTHRMTVPVSIKGQGPYRFIVDTGAERTVIAEDLADELGLQFGGMARVHSMSEVSEIRTVRIPALEVGGKKVRDIHAPALARRNLGAAGMLGVDSLQNQRVSFDFEREEMNVVPSRRREEKWPEDTIVVTARSRFGHLVLVDASVDGQRVWVIVDTGSQVTVGNGALRRKLEKKKRLPPTVPVEMLSVTGGRIAADRARIREIMLGNMHIRDLPVAFADVHPFRQLDLMDRPALLLGMDALKLFDRVSVDFANRRVRLLSPGRTARAAETMLARAGEAPEEG